MPEAALSYVYRYAGASEVVTAPAAARLRLAAQVTAAQPRLFLRGRLASPKQTGELLLTLMEVVDARFFVPGAMLARILRLADPVVTCAVERIRFEAFSQCCGAYARVDLLDQAVDGELINPGTTNVDFNAPMRAGLARLSDSSPAALTIGADCVELESDRAQVVERKVKLPQRWLRGFVEVQAFQVRMRPAFTATGAALRRLLQELRSPKGTLYVSAAGPAIGVHSNSRSGAVAVGGIERLKVLGRAARHAERVEIFSDEATGACAWAVYTPGSRFQYVLSPEPSRGFSGEGQTLEALACGTGGAVGAVRAALRWQTRIDPGSIAVSHSREEIDRALAVCAASGLIGFDLSDHAYFHRELPFDLSLIHKHQARLVSAEKLLAQDNVEFDGAGQAWVASGANHYRVWLGAEPRCTCTWVAKHGASRGPCKHILAARAAQTKAEA